MNRVKRCRHYYSIETQYVAVPLHLQTKTRLPGDPQGNDRLGFALLRRQLLAVARLERERGGQPVIRKIPSSVVMPGYNRGESACTLGAATSV